MSTDTEQVYECGCCAWLLRVTADMSFSEVQSEFDSHDCKANSLKGRPSLKNDR